jgi:ribulose kinase
MQFWAIGILSGGMVLTVCHCGIGIGGMVKVGAIDFHMTTVGTKTAKEKKRNWMLI